MVVIQNHCVVCISWQDKKIKSILKMVDNVDKTFIQVVNWFSFYFFILTSTINAVECS